MPQVIWGIQYSELLDQQSDIIKVQTHKTQKQVSLVT